MKIPRIRHSRRVLIITLTCVCVLVWVIGRHRIKQMDERFFQYSEHGAWGLIYYLLGDYSRAAKASRAHFADPILEHGNFGDPMPDALVRGKRTEATSLAQTALAQDPDHVHALLTLGEVAYEAGDLDQAARLFAAMLEKRPEQIDALLLSSLAYAKKAIAAGDRPADAYLSLGITYEREGRRREALPALLKAIDLDAEHAYAYRWSPMGITPMESRCSISSPNASRATRPIRCSAGP